MFDKLFEFIISFWNDLKPFYIVNQYERAVHLRFGKLHIETVHPGIHWKMPFFDKVIEAIVSTDTLNISEICITTTDNKTIIASAAIEFQVIDVQKFLIQTNEAISNMHDICRGIISDYLMDSTWSDCTSKRALTTITGRIKKRMDDIGVEIKMVTFTDMCLSLVLKQFNDK